MNITFWKTSDDPRTVNKTMTKVGSGEATLTTDVNNTAETISLLNPVFIVKSNSAYFNATHVAVATMGNRYYFLNNITLLTGGKMELQCSIDVLKTYETQLNSCKATAIRSQSAGKNYISDSKYPLNTIDRYVTMQGFPKTPFTRTPVAPYVLTTIGGT